MLQPAIKTLPSSFAALWPHSALLRPGCCTGPRHLTRCGWRAGPVPARRLQLYLVAEPRSQRPSLLLAACSGQSPVDLPAWQFHPRRGSKEQTTSKKGSGARRREKGGQAAGWARQQRIAVVSSPAAAASSSRHLTSSHQHNGLCTDHTHTTTAIHTIWRTNDAHRHKHSRGCRSTLLAARLLTQSTTMGS